MADGHANVKLEFDFVKQGSKAKGRLSKKRVSDDGGTKVPPKKRRVEHASTADFDDMYESDDLRSIEEIANDDDSTEGEKFDWSFSLREEPVSHAAKGRSKVWESEVIVLSDSDD